MGTGTSVALIIVAIGTLASLTLPSDLWPLLTFVTSMTPFVLVALLALMEFGSAQGASREVRVLSVARVAGALVVTAASIEWLRMEFSDSAIAFWLLMVWPLWGCAAIVIGIALGWLAGALIVGREDRDKRVLPMAVLGMGTRGFVASMALGAFVSLAFQLDILDGIAFVSSMTPYILIGLLALFDLGRAEKRGRRGRVTAVARVCGAALISTIFVLWMWIEVRWGESSTAGLVFTFMPAWSCVTVALGALLGWPAGALANRLAASA